MMRVLVVSGVGKINSIMEFMLGLRRRKNFVGAASLLLLAFCLGSPAGAQSHSTTTDISQINSRPHGFMERADPKAIEQAIKAQQRHNSALFAIEDVQGTAVGWREDGATVVKVYVEHPGNGQAWGPDNRNAIPASVDGIPVVIEEAGPFYAENVPCEQRKAGTCGVLPVVSATAGATNPKEWQPRPVPIGVSTGHIDVTAGTLACRVNNGCHVYALSNAHVFANENAGQPGDEIVQPGVYDGGTSPADVIAVLYDAIPIVMSSSASNTVDAALAQLDSWTVGKATPPEGYGTPRIATAAAVVNMDVMKYGRTTGMTYGYVDAINASILVNYQSGLAKFVNQMIIKPTSGNNFSRPGDSGSLVVATGGEDDRKPVGLIFSSGTGISIANPIDLVLAELDVDIDGD